MRSGALRSVQGSVQEQPLETVADLFTDAAAESFRPGHRGCQKPFGNGLPTRCGAVSVLF
jgi:hypothetical protein